MTGPTSRFASAREDMHIVLVWTDKGSERQGLRETGVVPRIVQPGQVDGSNDLEWSTTCNSMIVTVGPLCIIAEKQMAPCLANAQSISR